MYVYMYIVYRNNKNKTENMYINIIITTTYA
jgi:hypothetical protein